MMQPINDNNVQNDLAKLFIQLCESQKRIAEELVVMSSIVKDLAEKAAWNI